MGAIVRLLGRLAQTFMPADLFDVWLEEPEGWDEREHP